MFICSNQLSVMSIDVNSPIWGKMAWIWKVPFTKTKILKNLGGCCKKIYTPLKSALNLLQEHTRTTLQHHSRYRKIIPRITAFFDNIKKWKKSKVCRLGRQSSLCATVLRTVRSESWSCLLQRLHFTDQN